MLSTPKPDEEISTVEDTELATGSTEDQEAEIAHRLELLTGPDEPEAVTAPPKTQPGLDPVVTSDPVAVVEDVAADVAVERDLLAPVNVPEVLETAPAPAPVPVEVPKTVPAPVQPMKPAAAKPNNKSALLVSLVYILYSFCGMFGVCNNGSGKSLNIA